MRELDYLKVMSREYPTRKDAISEMDCQRERSIFFQIYMESIWLLHICCGALQE